MYSASALAQAEGVRLCCRLRRSRQSLTAERPLLRYSRHSSARVLKPGGLLSITEDFFDPDYPLVSETVRRVEAAGFSLERRFGNFWLYTLNFRRDAALGYPE